MTPTLAIQFLILQINPIARNRCRRTLRTEELSRDVQGLASHNYDLLAIEQLLSNSAGQPTKEVTLAIDRDLVKIKASAIRSIIPIHPKLGQ